MLACLPSVAVTTLLAYEVIPPTPGLALGLFVLLVVLDLSGWRVVSAMFDREAADHRGQVSFADKWR